MGKQGAFTKALATAGALLAWFPIVATIVVAMVGSIRAGAFRFDYLMPAELFPLALAGGGLLLWAAIRARSRRGLIGWGLTAMVVLLAGGLGLAEASGLASGKIAMAGLPFMLVLASLAAYTLALVEIGYSGVLLLRDLF